jgi:DNA polymerase I-like protein with 3'-5' exonuclease and polymerase domains
LAPTSITPKAAAVLDAALRMVETSDVVALDIETTRLDLRGGEIRLVQVSNGEKTYVLDLWTGLDARPLFEALSQKTVLAHGGDFEWRWIYHHFGIELDNIRDTMLMARLTSCGNLSIRSGLGEVAARELGLELHKEMQGADWTLERLTKRHLDYAALDAQVLLPLYQKLGTQISETKQERVMEIEFACLPAVALMKYVGMPVDKGAWDARAEEAEAELKALEKRMLDAVWMPERPPIPQTWALQGAEGLAMLHASGLTDITGTTAKDLAPYAEHELVATLLAYRKAKGKEREGLKAKVLDLAPKKPDAPAPPWNFGSPQQVTEIAYELLGFELESTEEGSLLRYKSRHPFFEHMLEHRKLKKLVSTYGKAWFQKAYDEKTGRVYPAWWQIGTSTGRLASGEKYVAPNAQNLPAEYRKFFVAPEGRTFVDADYSQIEVRILAKMLNEERLLDLYGRPDDDKPSEDVYRDTAASMLGIERDAVNKEQRNLAKAIMLGMSYGLSDRGLPYYAFTKFGIADMSPDDAAAYVRAFYDLYPKIEGYHEDVLKELRERGTVDQRTMTGRLRADITNRNEAINAPIQGTAADGLKAAMALVYERLKGFDDAFIIASIHDELLIECNDDDAEEVATIVGDSMRQAMDEILNAEEPKVKIEIDVTISKHWTKG